RKLLRVNPMLAALPHVAFTPQRPSEYHRIRRQPAEMCVSTIEALAEVLDIIEPDSGPFDRLLDPFRAMVDRQERFINEVGAYRHRRVPRVARPSRRVQLAARLSKDWSRLVCVQGDSNAWPRRDPARQPPEIVHWVAYRPATGETFDAVVAPRRPLAAGTAAQTELSTVRIENGCSADSWRQTWEKFLRPDDVAVTWGSFYAGLATGEGLALPPQVLDLRREALVMIRAERIV
ncbi:MAG: DTW domain-containing protein, partial [Deltaproteobacteria bacterium]|nr:DTW domain-containing protein [Deltaproteobacteria bacterium]